MGARGDTADLVAQAYTYDLEMPKSLMLASLEAVEACSNGIGPDWLPECARAGLTEYLGYFAAAAVVHDWEYQHESDRSFAAFTRANERLRRNCKLLLRKGYPWYKRWLYRNRADMIADACQLWGWGAWQHGQK
jgi:hypothetical protein